MTGIIAAAGAAAAAARSGFLIDPGTQNYSAFEVPPTNARSGVRLNVDRSIEELRNFAYIDQGDWLESAAAPADYEARVTVVSGILDFGLNAGQWYALTGNREWGIQTEVTETDNAELTVEIRRIADTSDIITFTVNLEAISTAI